MLEIYLTLLLAGAIVGVVPYLVGRGTNKPVLGRLGWIWTTLSGLLMIQFFVAIVFVIVILVRQTDYGVAVPQAAAPIRQPQRVNGSTLGITCLAGPLKGRTYSIDMSGLMIGRESDCAIRFGAESAGISRHHCSLRWANGNLYLTDLGSTYGTYMSDGRRLAAESPVVISAGSRFYLADSKNLFQIVIQV